MGIILNNGVTNLKNTPSAITDVIANRPVATSVSEGCIFISTDTAEMYSNVSGSWVLIGGGGGGGNQNLQQVTDVGNVTTNDIYVNSVYYNDFASPTQYGRLSINDFGWIFTDIDNVIRCVIQEGAIALKNKITNYQWRLDSENLTKNFVFQMPNSLSGFIQDIIPISVNGVYADINGDIAISTGGSTGVNGLNGTTNIGLGGTMLNDTTIDADNFSLNIDNIKILNFNTQNGDAIIMTDLVDIKTVTGGLETGIFISGTNAKLGYYANDAFFFHVNSSNSFMATVINNNNVGLYIDFTGFSTGQVKYILGDQTGYTGNTSNIEVNGTLDTIFLKTSSIVFSVGTSLINANYNGTDNGLQLNFANNVYSFGDYGFSGYALTINAATAQASFYCSTITLLTGNGSGFNAQSNETKIGDVDGAGNLTIFGVDDNLETLIATNVITQPNTISPTLDALKIRINGTDYLIPLYQ